VQKANRVPSRFTENPGHGGETVSQPLQGHPSHRDLVTAIAWAQMEETRLLEQSPVDRHHNAAIDSPLSAKRLESGLQAETPSHSRRTD